MARRHLTTSLVCVAAFAAYGVAYAPGAAIPEADTQRWPKGTLDNRIRNGFVKWGTIAVEVPSEDTDPMTNPDVLRDFTKEELKAFADEHFGAAAKDLSAAKLSKADLLLAVRTLVADAAP